MEENDNNKHNTQELQIVISLKFNYIYVCICYILSTYDIKLVHFCTPASTSRLLQFHQYSLNYARTKNTFRTNPTPKIHSSNWEWHLAKLAPQVRVLEGHRASIVVVVIIVVVLVNLGFVNLVLFIIVTWLLEPSKIYDIYSNPYLAFLTPSTPEMNLKWYCW